MKILTKLLIAFVVVLVLVPIYITIMYLHVLSLQKSINGIINYGIKTSYALYDIRRIVENLNVIAETNQINQPASKIRIAEDIVTLNTQLNTWTSVINYRLNDSRMADKKSSTLQAKQNLLDIRTKLENFLTTLSTFDQNKSLLNQQTNELRIALNNAVEFNKNTLGYEQEKFTALFFQTRVLATLMVSFILITIFIIVFLMARSIIKRLSVLEVATISIANKDYNISIKDQVGDEITILSHAFNDMASSINNSNKYIAGIINTMPNIFIVTDINLKIKSTNQTTSLLLGYSQHELLNMTLLHLFTEHYIEEIKQLKKSSKIRFLRKDGTELPAVISTSTLNLDNNEIEIIYIAQDSSQLEEAEKNMILSSRQAGMADIATNVLHNVGNILNTIGISSMMLQEGLNKSKMQNLDKLADLLTEQIENIKAFFSKEENSKNIANYIITLAKTWHDEKAHLLTETELLRKNITYVHNIITIEQSMYKIASVVEITSISEVIDDALSINKNQYGSCPINIIKEIDPIKKAHIDRVKLLQVLINLIKYAIESLIASKNDPMRLEIILAQQDEAHFTIKVKDNGLGISDKNINEIFTQGFTSSANEHGFSLHWIALSIEELGGSINVSSEGDYKGTTFVMLLPYEPTRAIVHERVDVMKDTL